MRVVVHSVTEAGAAVARRLPWPHRHGELVSSVRSSWHEVDGLVLVCATGIAVRAVAPLLAHKHRDPAVVCVDGGGQFAVALSGGHAAGANALARQVAALLGATPVVSGGSDVAGLAGLDTFPGFVASGDIAGVTRAWLDGSSPGLSVDPELSAWPVPAPLATLPGLPRPGGGEVLVTDRAVEPGAARVVLTPVSLVVGLGASTGADPAGMADLVASVLKAAGLSPAAVGLAATLDRKADEPAIAGWAAQSRVELRTFRAETLRTIGVPSPSPAVEAAVGTPSVAEAAALAAAGPDGQLVVTKRASRDATVAVARRRRPEGRLAVVGLGPGDPALRAPAATAAVLAAEVVIGYERYVDLAGDLLEARHEVVRTPIGAETDRCAEALARAAAGQRVALVCSGDAGVYAMASLVCELAGTHGSPPITVVPGITAALAAAAVLGAPLGHDHAAVSLSDLLTPWAVIERRLQAVADGDFVVSLYNPRSRRRTTQLERALAILTAARPRTTPAAVVTDCGRPSQDVIRTTLDGLDPAAVGMLSLVVVGSSTSRWIGERMVTPRGYAR